jgi:hypothetical protein
MFPPWAPFFGVLASGRATAARKQVPLRDEDNYGLSVQVWPGGDHFEIGGDDRIGRRSS